MRIHEKSVILGIESSCDETSAAVVVGGRLVLSNIIASQIDIHKKYGGVVPEIASRKHIEVISHVVDTAVSEAGISLKDVDALSVTCGPGLVGALLIGLSYAKGLAYTLKKPLVGVNHIHGHICSNYLENNDFTPPFICAVISGGHTNIVRVNDYDRMEILGRTADDAAGEAFDKVARAIGLGYPGGPKIDALAKTGDPTAFILPTAFNEDGNLSFSFSGLKSAVLNLLNKAAMRGELIKTEDLAASFQKTVVDVLVKKAISACRLSGLEKLALAGGVSCNSALRAAILSECAKSKLTVNIPSPVFCTDNAAMIASCGFYNINKDSANSLYLNAYPNLELTEIIV